MERNRKKKGRKLISVIWDSCIIETKCEEQNRISTKVKIAIFKKHSFMSIAKDMSEQ